MTAPHKRKKPPPVVSEAAGKDFQEQINELSRYSKQAERQEIVELDRRAGDG